MYAGTIGATLVEPLRQTGYDGVTWSDLFEYVASCFVLQDDLVLADLTSASWFWLETQHYDTQRESRRLHDAEEVDGLLVPCWFDPTERLVVLFPRAARALPSAPVLRLDTRELHRSISQLAATVGIGPYITSPFLPSGIVDADGCLVQSQTHVARRVVADVREIADRLIHDMRAKPSRLFELSPRRFEELVAELFERGGYSVSLTAPSRDGGADLFAVRKDHFAEFCVAVECKRYRSDRPVGVGVVRALYGVVDDLRVSAGAVVTTSSFTSGALNMQRNLPMRLALHDYAALVHWLDSGHGATTSAFMGPPS